MSKKNSIFGRMSNLGQRVIVSSLIASLILLAITLSTVPYFRFFFILVVMMIISGALLEFFTIAKQKKCQPLVWWAICFSIVYVLATFLSAEWAYLEPLPQLTLLAMLVAVFAVFFVGGSDPLLNIAMTSFGIIYVTIPLTYMMKINYFFPQNSIQDGRLWLFYLLTISKITDVGAYFCGKSFGCRKIAPYISPNKTWEGAIGGLLSAVATSLLFYFLLQFWQKFPMQLSLMESVYLGLLIGIFSQFGDLTESLLKRDGGLKDSSQLPGLGGALDIVDSLIFTTPLLYFYLICNK